MQQNLKKLIDVFASLDEKSGADLLNYAEFLQSRQPAKNCEESNTLDKVEAITTLPRPKDERVIDAIKRLGKSYSMLDLDTLLKKSADLMSSNLMGGRDSVEVIDELEELFSKRYHEYVNKI
ncbi:MAG: hypothetical protein HOM84_04150 [Thiotrichales bacterium]|nr:hypothetical protein [Thiotrichales bacterium]MBT3614190.1 hypothetical protein [Thiotrichales bacterium]MBT3752008.1 hypothetical protein [Thiotrichales bacterium]MBT3837391.1 hypothetical protein [Thiotrichales bacterium]MBT4152676.1 hypothetical protein [Thiotrichales bacterium]